MNSAAFESVKEKFFNLDIVLIAGNYGAGKSEFAARYFPEAGFERVNRKEIRKNLYEMLHFGKKWENRFYDPKSEFLVKHTERNIVEFLLAQKLKVLVDNTSMDKDTRKKYIDLARVAHARIGIVFLDTETSECLLRNRQTNDPVEDGVISSLSVHKQLPAREEGFAEILIIKGIFKNG